MIGSPPGQGAVAAKSKALTAPFDAIAEKSQEPYGCLEKIFEGNQPERREGWWMVDGGWWMDRRT